MAKPWTPIRVPPEDPSKYDPQVVIDYIEAAYGNCKSLTVDDVPLGCSCGQEALEKLGYEHEEGDGYFPPDPRIPPPKFELGTLVVTKCGGVGIVRENDNDNYAVRSVKGYKHPPKVAWYCEEELRELKGEDYA